jgi:hypothetical protein
MSLVELKQARHEDGGPTSPSTRRAEDCAQVT